MHAIIKKLCACLFLPSVFSIQSFSHFNTIQQKATTVEEGKIKVDDIQKINGETYGVLKIAQSGYTWGATQINISDYYLLKTLIKYDGKTDPTNRQSLDGIYFAGFDFSHFTETALNGKYLRFKMGNDWNQENWGLQNKKEKIVDWIKGEKVLSKYLLNEGFDSNGYLTFDIQGLFKDKDCPTDHVFRYENYFGDGIAHGRKEDWSYFYIADWEDSNYLMGKTGGFIPTLKGNVYGLSTRETEFLIPIEKCITFLKNGETKDVFIKAGSTISVDSILSQINAEDVFGVPVKVQVSDEDKKKYNPNKLGVYSLQMQATDDYNQTATGTLNIHVIDSEKPKVTLKNGVSLGYKHPLDFKTLRSVFNIEDNSTKYGGHLLEPTFKIQNTEITSTNQTYKMNASHVSKGKLSVEVTVFDSSSNKFQDSFDIPLKDDVEPVLKRKDAKNLTTEVKFPIKLFKNYDSAKEAFLQLFTSEDEIDDNPLIQVENFPSKKEDLKVGIKKVIIKAIDASGNMASASLDLNIMEDLPVFIINPTLFITTVDAPLTTEEIQATAQTMILQSLKEEDEQILVHEWGAIDVSSYMKNTSVPDHYTFEIKALLHEYPSDVTEKDKEKYFNSFAKKFTISLDVIAAKKPSAWERFCQWWIRGFECLMNWLSGNGWLTNTQLKQRNL